MMMDYHVLNVVIHRHIVSSHGSVGHPLELNYCGASLPVAPSSRLHPLALPTASKVISYKSASSAYLCCHPLCASEIDMDNSRVRITSN
jgi:hypothetical protein